MSCIKNHGFTSKSMVEIPQNWWNPVISLINHVTSKSIVEMATWQESCWPMTIPLTTTITRTLGRESVDLGKEARPGSPAATYFRLALRNNNCNHQAKYSWSMLVYAGLMCSNMFQWKNIKKAPLFIVKTVDNPAWPKPHGQDLWNQPDQPWPWHLRWKLWKVLGGLKGKHRFNMF